MKFGLLNANIGKRIAIAAALPIMGIAIFGLYISGIEYSRYSSLDRLHRLASVAPSISSLVHELQDERGNSAGFISSGGSALWNSRITGQIEQTNAVMAEVLPQIQAFPAAEYGAEVEERLTLALSELEKLEDFREKTLSTRTTVSAMETYYTDTIRNLIDVMSVVSALADEATVKSHAVVYLALVEVKERAGLERAQGAEGYGAGEFSSLVHTNFVTFIGQQDAFMDVFNSFSTPEQREFYQATVAGTQVDEVEYLRDVAVESGYDMLYDEISSLDWFDNISAKIDLIKQVEDKVSNDLLATAGGIKDSAWMTLLVTVVSTLAAITAAGAICWLVGRSITRPLGQLQEVMGVVAEGNFDVTVAGTSRTDEVGDMAKAVEVFRDQGQEAARLKEEQQIAEERAAQEKRASLHKMADQLETSIGQMVETLTSSSTELAETARSMRQLAGSTNTETVSVNEASTRATENVESVATAATQLSNAISEVTEQIARSASLTQESQAASVQTDVQMKNLAEAASRIGSVVELIQEIAEQTNLLALNATIEAARAGEAGKGFAVVAAEVKDLANQTAKATGEISDHVSRVQQETDQAAIAMTQISEKIGEINQVTAAVSAAVEEQSSATQEISRSADQTAEMNRNVTSSIGNVQAIAEETGGAAEHVLTSAEALSETAEKLRAQVGEFVSSIRAA